jgi:putative ABC transport system permease protein
VRFSLRMPGKESRLHCCRRSYFGIGHSSGLLALAVLVLRLGGTYFVGRAMRSVLYQVSAIDFASVGAVALVLLVAAILACYLRARRATRIDPMAALRCE